MLCVLEVLLCVIVVNVGDELLVVILKVFEGKGNFGYNVVIGEYGDLVDVGVVDLIKVMWIVL